MQPTSHAVSPAESEVHVLWLLTSSPYMLHEVISHEQVDILSRDLHLIGLLSTPRDHTTEPAVQRPYTLMWSTCDMLLTCSTCRGPSLCMPLYVLSLHHYITP